MDGIIIGAIFFALAILVSVCWSDSSSKDAGKSIGRSVSDGMRQIDRAADARRQRFDQQRRK